MARKPKGSIIQPLPSWNLKRMVGASFGLGALGLGVLGAIGLLNNSSRGEWLVIWDLCINTVPNPIPAHAIIADIAITSGMLGGALIPPPETNSITSASPTQPGQVWSFHAPGNEAGQVFYSVSLITSGVTAFYQWPHEWPIAAIQPGDSIVAYSDTDPYTDWGATFMYEVVPGGI